MTKNRYVYICKFCGKEVVSLTKHYKKEHPEHVSEALSDGTQQRIAMGQSNPIEHIKKKPVEQPVEQKPAPKPEPKTEPKSEPMADDGGGANPDKSGSFLDCLDDF